MLKKILWATDGSDDADRALEAVKSLASDGAEVEAVHVCQRFASDKYAVAPAHPGAERVEAKIRDEVEELVNEGIKASLTVISDTRPHPAEDIAEAARDAAADMIVIGTRGWSAYRGLLVGTVAQRLIQIGPCPVLCVPPPEG